MDNLYMGSNRSNNDTSKTQYRYFPSGLIWHKMMKVVSISKLSFALFIVFLVNAMTLSAQGNFDWVAHIAGDASDNPRGLAQDGAGNVYATGDFGSFSAYFHSKGDIMGDSLQGLFIFGRVAFLTKYDVSGNFIWARGFMGSGQNFGSGVAVDADKNIYVVGYFASATLFFDSPQTMDTLTKKGTHDAYLVKYDPDGNYVWAKHISGGASGVVQGTGISIDGKNNIYITGHAMSSSSVDFSVGDTGATITPAASSNYNTFVAKYDQSGNYLWAKIMGGSALDYGYGIVSDIAGNVYVTGEFRSTTANFDPEGIAAPLIKTAGGLADIFLAKYDASGKYVWSKNIGGSDRNSVETGSGITLDASGNVFITGSFMANTVNFNPGGIGGALTPVGGKDIYIAKFDTSGKYIWANALGSSGDDMGYALTADNQGNVYVTGGFSNSIDFDPGLNNQTLTSAGGINAFVAKYDAGGNYVWAKRMGSNAYEADEGRAITLDKRTDVFVAGSFRETADFNPGSGAGQLTSWGTSDGYIVKLRQSCEAFTDIRKSVCGSYVFNGTTYDKTGTYYMDTFVSSTNCDSITVLHLTVLDTIYRNSQDTAVCYSYLFNGKNYVNSGTYADTFRSVDGCDSIMTIRLTIKDSTSAVISLSDCNAVKVNGIIYDSTGRYTQTFTNAQGCDSIAVYEITIGKNESTLELTVCDSLMLNDTLVYRVSGNYEARLINSAGCDSVLSLHLTVNNSPTASAVLVDETLMATEADAYQWLNCDAGRQLIPGAVERNFEPEQTGNYAVVVAANGCSDTSACIYVALTTGVPAIGRSNLVKLYPNPAADEIRVQSGRPLEKARIRLYNILGQTLQQHNNVYGNVFYLNLTNLTNGIYFVDINEEASGVRLKLIKE